ncbi:MAG: efflux RND transporter periplasmic adaptor subunit [Bacteroidetes bacterium]|nr:efflux RND transporter periplasmic adaptor subunit [Bacteroidota bacterium]
MRKIILLMLSIIFIDCNSKNNNTIEASGTLETNDIRISSKTFGEIKNIFVEEGSQVKKDDTIALIDTIQLYLQLKQATAGVSLAKAQYDLLTKGARKEDINQGEEQLKQAETNEKLAYEDFLRMKTLFASNSISLKQFNDAEARYKITKAQLSSAREGSKKLKSFSRPEEIIAAEARLIQAEANAELFKSQLNNAIIKAPINGTISHLPMNVGELINPNGIICTISQIDELTLTIYISEVDLGKIKINDTAFVSIDSFEDKKFIGRVMFISKNAEFTPRNIQTKDDRATLVYAVKIKVKNESGILKSGMPADATIEIKN